MAASQAGHLDVVEALIGAGASPSKTMWDGASPLFLAAQNGHARVLVHLLDQPGLPLDTQRRDGASPLWIAAQMGHEDCVRLLLRAGAKVDLARADGATPLFKACHKVIYQLFICMLLVIFHPQPCGYFQFCNNHPRFSGPRGGCPGAFGAQSKPGKP